MRLSTWVVIFLFIALTLFLAPLLPAAAADSVGPLLYLHRGVLDARRPAPTHLMARFAGIAPGSYAIIQFHGPILPADRQALQGTGLRLLEYLPDYAYLVQGSTSQLADAAQLPQVYAQLPFTLADKLAPGLLRAVKQGKMQLGLVSVVGWNGNTRRLSAALDQLPFDTRESLTREQLLQLATLESVRWIEPTGRPKILNDVARSIMGVDEAWQSSSFFGQGQIIGISDSGLDTGDQNTLSPDFAGRVVSTQILAQAGDWADQHGHGTHVAGSAAGAGVQSGADPNQLDYINSFAGTAPAAQLAIQAFEVLADGQIEGLPDDYYQLFDQMYGTGARLHSNSWGDSTGPAGDPSEYGGYVFGTRQTDKFVWEHPAMTVFAAAGNSGSDGVPGELGFCAGGDGVIDPDSIVSPGTAKNVITVGASESLRNSSGPLAGYPWLLVSFCFFTVPIATDPIADNSDGMAAFSSRGPTDDGRIKPDIVAPGVGIVSNRSQVPSAGELWGAYDDNYAYSGGTSMATPLTAGTGALVRQWLQQQGATIPSAALVKATLLNSTRDMAPGQYGTGGTQEIPYARPNFVNGWGLVDARFIEPQPGFGIWFDDHTAGLSTGQAVSYTHTLTRPLRVLRDTMPLRIMLAWTDPPASLSASKQLVNDLNLTVAGPGGTLFYGNGIAGGDDLNNVEGVVINSPTPGDYEITVQATNVPTATQPYALVVAGPVEEIIAVAISGLAAFNDSPTALGGSTSLMASVATGSGVSYSWDFGDGTMGVGAQTSHAYATTGEYTARVTASNALGQASATTIVTVMEAVAGLVASSDSPTLYGQATTLTAIVTAGTDVTYRWDFGDGITAGGENVSHVYALPGQYTAVVTASNTLGRLSASVLVSVTEAVSGLSVSSNSPVLLGSVSILSATVSSGGAVTYSWEFGDGTSGSGSIVNHTYSITGTHPVTVTASNQVSSLDAHTTVTILEPVSMLYLPAVFKP